MYAAHLDTQFRWQCVAQRPMGIRGAVEGLVARPDLVLNFSHFFVTHATPKYGPSGVRTAWTCAAWGHIASRDGGSWAWKFFPLGLGNIKSFFNWFFATFFFSFPIARIPFICSFFLTSARGMRNWLKSIGFGGIKYLSDSRLIQTAWWH